jgi:Alkylmercury lyase
MTTTYEDATDFAASCCAPVATTPEVEPASTLDTCCSIPSNDDENSEVLAELRSEEVAPEVAALRSAGFQLLLEHGQPVERDEWAEAAGVDQTTLTEVLERATARGRVELDPDGRLLGIAGLTIEPTRHRLDINGTRWTWCALDAIGILGALQADGTVYSTAPGTGEDIEITFRNGIPDGDATLFILGGHDDVNVVEAWCPLVNFFISHRAAEEWVATQQLEGDIVSVAQVAEEAAEMWKPVVDLGAPQVC